MVAEEDSAFRAEKRGAVGRNGEEESAEESTAISSEDSWVER